MYYNNLYEKNYVADDSDLTICVKILPKLEGWEIYPYSDTYIKFIGAEATVIEENSFKKIVPTSPLTKDWLAVIEDVRTDDPYITLYVTPYTKKIQLDSQIGALMNKLLFEAKKEYHDEKEREIRLYEFKGNSRWLKQCSSPVSFHKYDYCRLTSCLLDNSYEQPTEKGYFYGTVKKTIVDKKNELVDIITPISPYIFSDWLSNSFSILSDTMEYIEDGLMDILESIVELNENAIFFRIFYHYAKKDENLMKLYKETISAKSESSILKNPGIVKMLETYRDDVRKALKSEDTIADIYDIIHTPQPLENLPYALSLSEQEQASKFKGETKVLQAFFNGEYYMEYVSNLNKDLCTNFDIVKIREDYSSCDVYYFTKK